jgi:hypothetical protein
MEPQAFQTLESGFCVLLRSFVVSWDSRFAEPIVLRGGVKLASLREAIAHLVNTVPSSERRMPGRSDSGGADNKRGRTPWPY